MRGLWFTCNLGPNNNQFDKGSLFQILGISENIYNALFQNQVLINFGSHIKYIMHKISIFILSHDK